MRGGQPAARKAWTWAGAVSLAGHLLVLGVATWLLGRSARPVEAPVLNVQLVTLTPRRLPLAPRGEEPSPARAPKRPALHRPVEAPAEVAPLPLPPAAAPIDPAEGVARALSGRLGCPPGDLSRLGREARDRCRTALAETGAGRDGASPRLDLSRQGRIAEDPDFDLSHRPKNGCKVRAAGSRDPMGKEGAAAGVSCAWSF